MASARLQPPSSHPGARLAALLLVSALSLTACSASGVQARSAAAPAGRQTPGPAPTPAPAVPTPGSQQTTAAGPALLPAIISNGPRARRAVALTFDADLTAFMQSELDTGVVRSFDNRSVIDELTRMQVPATFFLTGLWMLRYPDETRRLAANPQFELGAHSYGHRGFTPRCFGLGQLAPSSMLADVRATDQVLRRFAPGASNLFRFPGGCYDRTALRAIAPQGLQVVQYDVAGGDAFARSVAGIVRTTLTGVRPGSIVVLHVNGGNTAPLTALALPAIITGLRQRGYTLTTVSGLFAPLSTPGRGPAASPVGTVTG